MDALRFSEMMRDKHLLNFEKMKYKYPENFYEFLSLLKSDYYEYLPLPDFNGKSIAWLKYGVEINPAAMKKLLCTAENPFNAQGVEREIISTMTIENIDFSRDSVRNIMRGLVPKDDEEKRIDGMKKGFEFICDSKNEITEENFYMLYKTAVGDFLDDKDKLAEGEKYRNDSVYVVGAEIEHTGIDHKKLPGYMKQLFSFIRSNDNLNDLTKAAIVHFYICYLHPYFDGNGRMARLLHLWYLLRRGYDSALFVPFSGYIEKSRKKYYDAYSLIEKNYRLTGVLDVTPFLHFFNKNVYDKIAENQNASDISDDFRLVMTSGEITEKESQLWKFVAAFYGQSEFSTKQLEKDFGNAAYATIRSFVLKFHKLGLLSCARYKNRNKYRINN